MLGIRWTIGDVKARGFAALRASLHGAAHLFGDDARYVVYVNTISIEDAKLRTGAVPPAVEWRSAPTTMPGYLGDALDAGMAEGVAWKLLPLRAFPDAYELSLDNDVVLWDVPHAIRDWLAGDADFVLAADVRASFGRFAPLCGDRPLNSGIRGLPPGFSLDAALMRILRANPGPLISELDEQGLQCASLLRSGTTAIVELDEVTICSPFPPHVEYLGRAGAHFVGINTHVLGFQFAGRPAEEVRAAHWDVLASEVARRVGLLAAT